MKTTLKTQILHLTYAYGRFDQVAMNLLDERAGKKSTRVRLNELLKKNCLQVSKIPAHEITSTYSEILGDRKSPRKTYELTETFLETSSNILKESFPSTIRKDLTVIEQLTGLYATITKELASGEQIHIRCPKDSPTSFTMLLHRGKEYMTFHVDARRVDRMDIKELLIDIDQTLAKLPPKHVLLLLTSETHLPILVSELRNLEVPYPKDIMVMDRKKFVFNSWSEPLEGAELIHPNNTKDTE